MSNDVLKLCCPQCGKELTPRHFTMWTGMRNIVTQYQYVCAGDNHGFSIRGKTEEEIQAALNTRNPDPKMVEEMRRDLQDAVLDVSALLLAANAYLKSGSLDARLNLESLLKYIPSKQYMKQSPSERKVGG